MKRKMKTSHLCISLLGIALVTACGEDYHEPVWSHTFESDSTNYESCGIDIGIDLEGNIIVVGEYEGQVSVGGEMLPYTRGTANFVAKYTSDGIIIWSKQLIAPDNRDLHVGVDRDGNIMLAGNYSNEITLGNSSHTAVGRLDVFVAKMNPSGEFLWSQSFAGSDWTFASGIDVDSESNIILSGMFKETLVLGSDSLTSVGAFDGFLLYLDSSGNYQWSRHFGGESDDGAGAPHVSSSGNIGISGSRVGTRIDGLVEPIGQVAKYSTMGELGDVPSLVNFR